MEFSEQCYKCIYLLLLLFFNIVDLNDYGHIYAQPFNSVGLQCIVVVIINSYVSIFFK